jgi:hypothetical protein
VGKFRRFREVRQSTAQAAAVAGLIERHLLDYLEAVARPTIAGFGSYLLRQSRKAKHAEQLEPRETTVTESTPDSGSTAPDGDPAGSGNVSPVPDSGSDRPARTTNQGTGWRSG